MTEGCDRLTGARIECDELEARRDGQDAARLARLGAAPEGDAAARAASRRARPPLSLVQPIHPEGLSGCRIDRDHVAAQPRAGVQHAIRHQGRSAKVELGSRAEVVGLPAPGDPQLADVFAVDLGEWGVTRAGKVTSVVQPLGASEPAALRAVPCCIAASARRPAVGTANVRKRRHVVAVAEGTRVGRGHRAARELVELLRRERCPVLLKGAADERRAGFAASELRTVAPCATAQIRIVAALCTGTRRRRSRSKSRPHEHTSHRPQAVDHCCFLQFDNGRWANRTCRPSRSESPGSPIAGASNRAYDLRGRRHAVKDCAVARAPPGQAQVPDSAIARQMTFSAAGRRSATPADSLHAN